jgi:hypothetical protein
MKKVAVAVLLCLAGQLQAQTLELPAEVKGQVGQFLRVPAKTDGSMVQWYSLDPGLNVFPVDLLKDSKTAVIVGTKEGRFRLMAYTALKDTPSLPAVCVIVIGDSPDPGPTPVPPGPTPPPPIPGDGLKVLIVTESGDKLTATQQGIIFGEKVRGYLREKAAKGPDGKTPEFRIFDKDVDASAEAKHWQDALRRPRAALPWIIISNGHHGFEGTLPATVEETMALLKKFGG